MGTGGSTWWGVRGKISTIINFLTELYDCVNTIYSHSSVLKTIKPN